jgi:hypothetical protein
LLYADKTDDNFFYTFFKRITISLHYRLKPVVQ